MEEVVEVALFELDLTWCRQSSEVVMMTKEGMVTIMGVQVTARGMVVDGWR